MGLIADYPFLLAVVASAFAESTAFILRRTAPLLGRWCWWLSAVLSTFACVGWGWSCYWAIQQGIDPYAERQAWRSLLGWVVLLPGMGLTAWAAAVLGRRTLWSLPEDRLETRPPYRYLRRPIGLGVAFLALGVALILNAASTWTWLLARLLLSPVLSELEEWELQARLPAATEWMRLTPRYLPRFWVKPSSRQKEHLREDG